MPSLALFGSFSPTLFFSIIGIGLVVFAIASVACWLLQPRTSH